MILIQEIVVGIPVLREQFACDVTRCKGACCVGGDFGAPIDDDEIELLQEEYEKIRPYMEPSGIAAVEEHGFYQHFDTDNFKGVTLREDLACAFVRIDDAGIAHCSIEEAWHAGATEFRKPISCHLYPLRIRRGKSSGLHAINYDKWSLCKPARRNGKDLGVPVYTFVREAIIRKYGEEFYAELEEVARALAAGELGPDAAS